MLFRSSDNILSNGMYVHGMASSIPGHLQRLTDVQLRTDRETSNRSSPTYARRAGSNDHPDRLPSRFPTRMPTAQRGSTPTSWLSGPGIRRAGGRRTTRASRFPTTTAQTWQSRRRASARPRRAGRPCRTSPATRTSSRQHSSSRRRRRQRMPRGLGLRVRHTLGTRRARSTCPESNRTRYSTRPSTSTGTGRRGSRTSPPPPRRSCRGRRRVLLRSHQAHDVPHRRRNVGAVQRIRKEIHHALRRPEQQRRDAEGGQAGGALVGADDFGDVLEDARAVCADDPSVVVTTNVTASDRQYLYWNLSTWNDYQVTLMRTDLSKV